MSVALSTLPVGAKVKDLTSLYPDGSPIIWTVIDHNHSGYPANSTTLFANKYNGFKKSESTKSVTNYNFTISDVYAYMVDEILENYISSSMKKKILKTPVNLLNWYGTGTYDRNILTVNLDIFLLSYGEMSSSGNLNSGDSRFSYFNDRSKRKGNDVGYGTNGYWTKDVQNSNNLKVLNYYRAASSSSDTIAYSFYSDELNSIRPVVNVMNDIDVQDSPDTDGAYIMSLTENKYLFKDGEEIKKWNYVPESYDEVLGQINIVPKMTSDNLPSPYEAISSSSISGSEAFRVFSRDGFTTYWQPHAMSGSWVGITLDKARIVYRYRMYQVSGSYDLKSYRFEGSNDKINWTQLDSRNTSWVSGWNDVTIGNRTAYKHYRVFVLTNQGGSNVALGELELFECSINTTSEIKEWEPLLEATVNKELFDLHGMTDLSLITDEAIQQLQSDQVELLCWTDEEGTIKPGSSIVPAMTGHNSPAPYIVSASEEYNVMPAWKAFNGIASTLTTAYNEWSTIDNPFGWIKIDLGGKEKVLQYSLTSNNHNERMAKSWVLEGSNDDIKWDQIDQRTEENLWGSVETRTYDILNALEYRYYRLNVTANNGDSTFLQISEIKLIRIGETIPPSLIASIEAIPSNNLIMSKGNIEVGDIENLLISSLVSGYADFKVVISHDNGLTWTGKNPVNINDLASVKENGFTPDELNALTKEEPASLFPEGKARFAFYLEQENVSDVVEIQSLSVGEKVYTVSPTIEDISVIYDMMEGEKPKLYASRDDGVTWSEVSEDMVKSLTDQPEGNKIRVKIVLKDGQEAQAVAYSWA